MDKPSEFPTFGFTSGGMRITTLKFAQTSDTAERAPIYPKRNPITKLTCARLVIPQEVISMHKLKIKIAAAAIILVQLQACTPTNPASSNMCKNDSADQNFTLLGEIEQGEPAAPKAYYSPEKKLVLIESWKGDCIKEISMSGDVRLRSGLALTSFNNDQFTKKRATVYTREGDKCESDTRRYREEFQKFSQIDMGKYETISGSFVEPTSECGNLITKMMFIGEVSNDIKTTTLLIIGNNVVVEVSKWK